MSAAGIAAGCQPFYLVAIRDNRSAPRLRAGEAVLLARQAPEVGDEVLVAGQLLEVVQALPDALLVQAQDGRRLQVPGGPQDVIQGRLAQGMVCKP
jgi:hypothetical protein